MINLNIQYNYLKLNKKLGYPEILTEERKNWIASLK